MGEAPFLNINIGSILIEPRQSLQRQTAMRSIAGGLVRHHRAPASSLR